MNAELFEDEALCNISPLPKHLFDVGGVPKPENNQITLPLFWTISRLICRGLLCFVTVSSVSSCLVNAHRIWDAGHGDATRTKFHRCVLCCRVHCIQYCWLGLHSISKIYRHCNIHIAANCLNCNRLSSMYQRITLCVTIHLALYSPRSLHPLRI